MGYFGHSSLFEVPGCRAELPTSRPNVGCWMPSGGWPRSIPGGSPEHFSGILPKGVINGIVARVAVISDSYLVKCFRKPTFRRKRILERGEDLAYREITMASQAGMRCPEQLRLLALGQVLPARGAVANAIGGAWPASRQASRGGLRFAAFRARGSPPGRGKGFMW